MSCNRFLASNKPLKKLENPHITYYSIDKAKELGFVDSIPNDAEKYIDSGHPYMFIVDKEDNLYEPEINPVDDIEKEYIEETLKSYSKKNYFAQIDFHYNKKRAKMIIDYLKEHLNECDEVELWNTWFDNFEPTTIVYKTIEEISTSDIKEFEDWKEFSPYCIVVRKKKENL